ncbi:hypothetical protein K6966_14190 [Enterobacter cloacae complex sp.]|nr:hypothetical protein K6966_14190 [Enterobacter cloacae complex sp.]
MMSFANYKYLPSMQALSILSCFLATTIFEVVVFALPTKGILIYNIIAFSSICVLYAFLNKNDLETVGKPSDLILPVALGRVRISTLRNENETFSQLNSITYIGVFLRLVTYSHLP